ncbi:Mg2+-importing ATPase [Breznakia sp. PF5-3]|uniref:magnesium-translocating P-type ATPase n=1 Tax=unclassified Breznakia TaxID=2623764 RepID=UPI002405D94E|nr:MULTISPECIES: magnesium-translocating P-type ATPase [unclassified Breznakia]MDF9825096.1 Mg2+-importing ATPase [Breznakia sp. PM6-1]MDF9835927.1 Mg2+-importing ATPase [Breznakia sp. PF5-3]MDF9837471.1 Mg2+-importing ATPase [Breznakia sp. PFB2-8]MDF9859466.1 Mg2+-importing ATPase [Breznakia sp. PH5-24]
MAKRINRASEVRLQEHKEAIKNRLLEASKMNNDEVLLKYHTTMDGLSDTQVEKNVEMYGENIISKNKEDSVFKRLYDAFINPFTVILIVLVGVSFLSDVVLAAPKERDYTTIIIISCMVFISGILRFVQESRSNNAAEKLNEMIETTTKVKRLNEQEKEIPLDEIVVGDIIYFSAGDMIPADMRVLNAKDLFVNQGSLTGESEPVEKFANNKIKGTLTETSNLIFMGSNVVSGSAIGVVLSVGDDTTFGSIVGDVNQKAPETSFEIGINKVSWVLIRFMLVMVPIVFVINGLTKNDWLHALMFAISIAVGLTPEMLPMITTTCLAKGAVAMSKKKVIVKNMNSIQNFGAMDILCTDKTGTITVDKVVLQHNLDVHGNEDDRVLRHAFLNSYYQTGLKNFIDLAIINKSKQKDIDDIVIDRFEKVDEIPFDFNRRRMSVVVSDKTGKTQLITKGAVEEILSVCSFVEYHGDVQPIDENIKDKVLKVVEQLNHEGMRVIAVAQKSNPAVVGAFETKDEKDMVLIGYLAFLDPPKETTKESIRTLVEYGVEVKVLTGDNDMVTKSICRQVGIDVKEVILGSDLDEMSDEEVKKEVKHVDVFAKLSPSQKARLVKLMKDNGNVVGFMGDGINDAPAMNQSDIGISVDTAVDIAKESADIILLEKDLMVLEEGIIEGRKTYGNMIKYIKMTASSNFGNMFSVLVASAFLPFLPMSAVQLIFLNLIYDLSCTAIPWDNVDLEYLKKPRDWNADGIASFMKWIGPTSSIFDITTYILLYFVVCPAVTGGLLFHQISDPNIQLQYIAVFQTGWLIESIWTQTLVIHMIRTPKIPFFQSRASLMVGVFTSISIVVVTVIPYTIIGEMLHLTPLPLLYYGWLLLTIVLYMVLVTIVKKYYIKKHGELL